MNRDTFSGIVFASIIVPALSCSHCLYLAACLRRSTQDVTSVGGGGECDCVCVGFGGFGGRGVQNQGEDE